MKLVLEELSIEGVIGTAFRRSCEVDVRWHRDADGVLRWLDKLAETALTCTYMYPLCGHKLKLCGLVRLWRTSVSAHY